MTSLILDFLYPVLNCREATPLSSKGGLPEQRHDSYDDYQDKYTVTDYIAIIVGGPLSIFGFVWYGVGLYMVFESEIGGTCVSSNPLSLC